VGLQQLYRTTPETLTWETSTDTAVMTLDKSGNLTLNTGGAFSTTGTISASGYNNTNWDSAYSERRQWDGGNSNLNASTARTSLGLTGDVSTQQVTSLQQEQFRRLAVLQVM
jgi:hypothetical protein